MIPDSEHPLPLPLADWPSVDGRARDRGPGGKQNNGHQTSHRGFQHLESPMFVHNTPTNVELNFARKFWEDKFWEYIQVSKF